MFYDIYLDIFYVLYAIYYINIIYIYIYAMTSKILLRFALWFLQEGIGDHRPSIFLTQFKGGGAFLGSQAEPWQDAMMQENEQVGFVTLLYI